MKNLLFGKCGTDLNHFTIPIKVNADWNNYWCIPCEKYTVKLLGLPNTKEFEQELKSFLDEYIK